MKLKSKWKKEDLNTFDKLLAQSELNGFDNYNRNIGRLKLNKWLEQWTKKAKDEMFNIIKDW
jgi:hypothetical protein